MKDKEQKTIAVVNKSLKPVIVKTSTSTPVTPIRSLQSSSIVKPSNSVVAKTSSISNKPSNNSTITKQTNIKTPQKPNISNNNRSANPNLSANSNLNPSASSNPINSLKSIKPKPINKAVADDSLTKAQMDITIKIYELPLEVNINPKGEKSFL